MPYLLHRATLGRSWEEKYSFPREEKCHGRRNTLGGKCSVTAAEIIWENSRQEKCHIFYTEQLWVGHGRRNAEKSRQEKSLGKRFFSTSVTNSLEHFLHLKRVVRILKWEGNGQSRQEKWEKCRKVTSGEIIGDSFPHWSQTLGSILFSWEDSTVVTVLKWEGNGRSRQQKWEKWESRQEKSLGKDSFPPRSQTLGSILFIWKEWDKYWTIHKILITIVILLSKNYFLFQLICQIIQLHLRCRYRYHLPQNGRQFKLWNV